MADKSSVGFLFVVVGLGLFLVGLEQTLFPLGQPDGRVSSLIPHSCSNQLTGNVTGDLTWQDFYWVYIFAAAIGFSTTMAEPSLIAVAIKANSVSGGAIGVFGLRSAVAIGVGASASAWAVIESSPVCRFTTLSLRATSSSSYKL